MKSTNATTANCAARILRRTPQLLTLASFLVLGSVTSLSAQTPVTRGGIERATGETEVTIRSADDVIVALGRIERDLLRPRKEPVAVRTGDGQAVLGVLMKDSPLGVEVDSVIDGTAAALAGLTKGDKIVEIDEFDIEKPSDVNDALANHAIGSKLKLKWIRNNVEHQRDVVFISQQSASPLSPSGGPGSPGSDLETQRLREEVIVLRRQVQALTRAVRSLALLHQQTNDPR